MLAELEPALELMKNAMSATDSTSPAKAKAGKTFIKKEPLKVQTAAINATLTSVKTSLKDLAMCSTTAALIASQKS